MSNNLWLPSTLPEIKEIAVISTTKPLDVEFVVSGINHPIRTDEEAEETLLLLIPILATSNGCAHEISVDQTLVQIVRDIIEGFKNIGTRELERAYTLWSFGALEGIVPMYHGIFSREHIFSLLRAYMKHRGKIMTAINNRDYKKRFEDHKTKRKEQIESWVEDNFDKIIKQARDLHDNWKKEFTTEDFRSNYYKIANDRGMIKFEQGEREAIWEETKEWYHLQIRTERYNLSRLGNKYQVASFNKLCQNDDYIRRKRTAIAHRLIFLRKVIQRTVTINLKNNNKDE